MDSRTILDSAGAERLVGRGDMLFLSPDSPRPRRMQGVLVTDEEIKAVVDFLQKELGDPEYNEDIAAKQEGGAGAVGGMMIMVMNYMKQRVKLL
jgi:S-DNA-T family DNA segregation ATPase FtsK/SpoIIIE